MRTINGIILSAITVLLISPLFAIAAHPTRGNKTTTPNQILDSVIGNANKNGAIQDTEIDDVTRDEGQFDSRYKIANTLDSIRMNIAPYLQWFLYIGIAIATVLIIITGLQLTLSATSDYDMKKAKARMKNIIIGLFIMTGVYIIMKIILAVIGYFLQ